MKSTLSMFASSLLLFACSAPPYPAFAIEDDAEGTAQVVVADASLQSVVRAGRPLVERTPQGDFLRIVVPIRNVDDEPIQVLVQASFLDSQRQQLPDETNRQVLLLPPGGTSNFEAISRQSRAADFVVRLSWNK
jgi:hypothetical protein